MIDPRLLDHFEMGDNRMWGVKPNFFDSPLGDDVEEYTDKRVYDDLVKEATTSLLPMPNPMPNPVPTRKKTLKNETGRKFR